MLSVAISSMVSQIPIAHIHGGELTHSAIDDSIRHTISKIQLLKAPIAVLNESVHDLIKRDCSLIPFALK